MKEHIEVRASVSSSPGPAGSSRAVYLDHPATSWPKPPDVVRAMGDFLENAGGNPGRSGHSLSIAAGRIVYAAREALCDFLNAPRPDRVIFTQNATHALNMVIRTVLRPGDTVLVSSAEHNSVMRPIRAAEAEGVEVLTVPCDPSGAIDPEEFRALASSGVRLVVLAHASNVIARIQPVAELAETARSSGAMVLIDAAQTVGAIPVDVREIGADFLAFTGHKALHGPPGTGGLVLCTDRAVEQIAPLTFGGTGSGSRYETQPEMLPDRLAAAG